MISDKMVKSINQQINREIYSGYLYLSMASYAFSQGFKGTSNWLTVQMQEEFAHATIMYNYVNAQGSRVILDAIEQPPSEFKSLSEIFERTLEHEKTVTKNINGLISLARKENDNATEIFYQWFVTEQVEEESNASEIINQLKIVGEKGAAIFMLDAELGKRVFVPPAQLSAKGA
jgi:ferritin